jgi:hypothetical protein
VPDRVVAWWATMRTSSSQARARPRPSCGCWLLVVAVSVVNADDSDPRTRELRTVLAGGAFAVLVDIFFVSIVTLTGDSRMVRLAHHRGHAVVRPPEERRLSAWQRARPPGHPQADECDLEGRTIRTAPGRRLQGPTRTSSANPVNMQSRCCRSRCRPAATDRCRWTPIAARGKRAPLTESRSRTRPR